MTNRQTGSHFAICTYNLQQNPSECRHDLAEDSVWGTSVFWIVLQSCKYGCKISLYHFAKGFWIEHDWWFEWSFSFFGCFTLVHNLTFFQVSYMKSCCFILSIIDEIFWSLYLTNASGFVWMAVYFLSIFSFKA